MKLSPELRRNLRMHVHADDDFGTCLLYTSQYHEGGSLKEMTLDGLLQLGLSDMKLIRCDVSIIHRHDIRIALHGRCV